MSEEHRMELPNESSISGEPAEGVQRSGGAWEFVPPSHPIPEDFQVETKAELPPIAPGWEVRRTRSGALTGVLNVPTTTCEGVRVVPQPLFNDMRAMLERLQWAHDNDGFAFCPICDAKTYNSTEHAPDCELAALLKRVRGEA